VYRILSVLIHSSMHFATRPELAIMIGRASQFVARPSIGWWVKQTRSAARVLWAKLLALLEAYRQRRAAESLYSKLSRLSDAELERRGIARGDLGRLISGMNERR
jgi:hypothetical protein